MKRFSLLVILMILVLSSCSGNRISTAENTNISAQPDTLKLKIDNTEVEVNWEDNESVRALKELCLEQPLTIEMSKYGDFEQVGPLGESLPSENVKMTTEPGDIVLYNNDQLVIFFGSNTWEYTKLGHTNSDQLKSLLDKDKVTVQIYTGGV